MSSGDCDSMRRAIALGHEVQSHTMDHFDLLTMTKDEIRAQLDRAQQWVRQCSARNGLAPLTMTQMRPPYGRLDRSRRMFIEQELGYDVVLWNVDSYDYRRDCSREGYRYGTVEAQRRRIRDEAAAFVSNDEAIVLLLHDHSHRLGLAQWLVDYFAVERGYEFVTMRQCCTEGECVTDKGHIEWRKRESE